MSAEQLEVILNKILKAYPQGFDLGNTTVIVIDVMKQVDQIDDMSGLEKKGLVLDILNNIVDKTDAGEYDKEIDAVLKIVIPTMIDKLVEVDQGKLKIRKNVKDFFLFKWCGECKPRKDGKGCKPKKR